MTSKNFALITAMTQAELTQKVNEHLAKGWHLQGETRVAYEPGTPWYLMQAMVADGTTDISPDSPQHGSVPEWYYVVVLAGQSNAMSYGEGMPLPDSYDAPHPRIKQLARRNTVTPGGKACAFNDIIPADHCLHDVQDMSALNHPNADLSKGQYGCVGQGLHIAKRLLPYIPQNAGILLVPCCRGGSAFTQGAEGTFSESTGASQDSARWGVGKPLYQDLILRTKAALQKNPKNMLLAVCWMQGEFDMSAATYSQQPPLFTAMLKQFRADITEFNTQCHGGRAASVPWICGDTTYYWKNTYGTQYDTIYGAYKNRESDNVFFVPFLTDGSGNNTSTNAPTEDPDAASEGYYGSASRTNKNWVSSNRQTHFSSWARRGIIPDRMATAILNVAGRTLAFISGKAPEIKPSPGGDTPSGPSEDASVRTISLLPTAGDAAAQGWSIKNGGIQLSEGVFKITKQSNKAWSLTRPVDDAVSLLTRGGRLSCKFRLSGALTNNQFGLGIYLYTDVALPDVVAMTGTGNPFLMSFFTQTTDGKLNLMHHKKAGNTKLGEFGNYSNDWQTLELVFTAGSATVTPKLNGVAGPAFQVIKDSLTLGLNALTATPPAGWLKCDGRAFTKEQYPVLARVYPTLRLPDLRGEFIRGWDDGRKVDTGRKLLSAQGATLLRTAMLDYYNQDTTGTSGIVGMGFNNEDSITDLREGSFKMPDGTTFSDPVVAMSDNGMQATILTSIRSGYAKGITVRPRSIALNYIVRAV